MEIRQSIGAANGRSAHVNIRFQVPWFVEHLCRNSFVKNFEGKSSKNGEIDGEEAKALCLVSMLVSLTCQFGLDFVFEIVELALVNFYYSGIEIIIFFVWNFACFYYTVKLLHQD